MAVAEAPRRPDQTVGRHDALRAAGWADEPRSTGVGLVVLDLISGSEGDEALATSFGDHQAIHFLRQSLGDADDDGGDGHPEGSGSRDALVPHRRSAGTGHP